MFANAGNLLGNVRILRAARESVRRAASGIYGATLGDPAALLAAGLEIEAEKRPVGRPVAPDQLRATASELEGVVQLRWKRPVRRCTFLVQMTRDPAAADGWQQVAISLRQSCEVTGLESGMKYWFRVTATNTQGQGPWSGRWASG
ncbi:MAG: fibronectin type III domain-containing protein [Verrucomicrobia bacterium]|nr:fibronectin type III domain-containing protein [Verrucomicrobiota bacterium]